VSCLLITPSSSSASASLSRSIGQIVFASALISLHRDLIISLAARHQLPTVFTDRAFVTAGGLASYGPNRVEQYRPAAGYVDRILKGEKPADLPVQDRPSTSWSSI
jgi:putative tryptophan/tyrosine transport system substrate-binding protein